MGLFSARHYRMIARRLAESKDHWKDGFRTENVYIGIQTVEAKLIELFEADSPNFEKQKFISASEGKK